MIEKMTEKIEPWFREREGRRLEEKVKGMTPEQREEYLKNEADIYISMASDRYES